jgi:hypothetical protein
MNKSAISEENFSSQKTAKYCAIGWTIVYLILFPFFFYIALLSAMIFDSPRMTISIGLWTMFMYFWIPLSMLASIYLMWSNYSRRQYKKTCLYWLLPFFTISIVLILDIVLEALFL